MRLCKRGEYGLRAMIDLATWDHGSAVFQIKDIDEREQIPLKFLEQILLTLKNAGLLQSKMGVGGGYYLSRPPEEITLGQIERSWMVRLPPSAASARWLTNRVGAGCQGS